jgi:eight-cysteine-cluster-containing protein
MQKPIYILFIILSVLVLLYGFFNAQKDSKMITSFEECISAGYPVLESYPPQCKTSDGRNFVEETDAPITPIDSTRPAGAYDDCIITGCNGQICASEDVITTCEIREEYACYRSTICERNRQNNCGWRDTDTLRECMGQYTP